MINNLAKKVENLVKDIEAGGPSQNMLQVEFLLLQLELVEFTNALTNPEIEFNKSELVEKTLPLMEKVMGLYQKISKLHASDVNGVYSSDEILELQQDFDIMMATFNTVTYNQKPGSA